MKIYEVWSGEYEDRCLLGTFLNKEKAEKLIELENQLNYRLDDCYLVEEETMDDQINLDDDVNKYYYTCYSLIHKRNETDWCWEQFKKDFNLTDDQLTPEIYEELLNGELDEVEDNYWVSTTRLIGKDTYIVTYTYNFDGTYVESVQEFKGKEGLIEIEVKSRKSYVEAKTILNEILKREKIDEYENTESTESTSV